MRLFLTKSDPRSFRTKEYEPAIPLSRVDLARIAFVIDERTAWRPPETACALVFVPIESLSLLTGFLFALAIEGESVRVLEVVDGTLKRRTDRIAFVAGSQPVCVEGLPLVAHADDAQAFHEALLAFVEHELNPTLADRFHCRDDAFEYVPIVCESGLSCDEFTTALEILCRLHEDPAAEGPASFEFQAACPPDPPRLTATFNMRPEGADILARFIAHHRPVATYLDVRDGHGCDSLRHSRWQRLPQFFDVEPEARHSALEIARVLAAVEALASREVEPS